jgi:hypothetical protein
MFEPLLALFVAARGDNAAVFESVFSIHVWFSFLVND